MSKNICKLCNSSKNIKIHQGVRHDTDAEIHQCLNCNFTFLSPWPTEDELGLYYANEYRNHYNEPPVEIRFRQDIDEARERMRRLLPLFSSSVRILEIGSGSGAFLDAAQPYASQVVGIEPDDASQRWITEKLGYSAYPSLLNGPPTCDKFDLIVMFHVLEHIAEPITFLKNIAKFAHQETKLIVEVPNIDDALVSVYQIPDYQDFYYQKAHLAYYSAQTLNFVLSQSNWSTKISMIQRYDLSNHMRWMQTGEAGGQGYYKMLDFAVTSTYQNTLIQSGHADTLWAVAQLN